ncbi:MAG TPA: hypothetical protein ENJ32_11580 [Crenotrichaceae bacterium]|nr:hypothetical protein [Crenotrichaceae bacterium]
MKRWMVLFALVFSMMVSAEEDPHQIDRQALRNILVDMKQALNQQDFSPAKKYLDENGVITYYNAEVTVGYDQAKQYFERMLKQSNAVVSDYSLSGDVSAPAIFHGNTAIAYGTTEEKFKLAEGLEFTLNGHWSATLYKKAGDWRIINLHFSANLFDNPLLRAARKMQWIIGVIAFLAGMLCLYLLTRLLRNNPGR